MDASTKPTAGPAPSRAATRSSTRELGLVALLSLAYLLLVRAGPLSLPYFWDEADVYVAGARWLADHDLDPTPGHFPDDWSRGHPPLLYLLGAVAFRLFGASPLVAHAAVLPFALLGLVATYALALERYGRSVAVAATLVLATTPLYLTMGAFFLPEMPLTALSIAALWAVHRERFWVAALLGVSMVWIKETGIFTSGAIGVALVVEAYRARALAERRTWRTLFVAALPLVALLGFFAWQRVHAGYYVFPHHQGLFTERRFALSNVLTTVPSLFLWQGRWVLTLLGLAAIPSVSRREPRFFGTIELASALLVLFNVAFFTQMFWLERYALPAHPALVVLLVALVARGLASELSDARREAGALGLVALLVSGVGLLSAYRGSPREAPELTFDYADVIRSHEALARLLERDRATLGADPVVVATWPLSVELADPTLGFVRRAVRVVHVDRVEEHPELAPDVVVVDPSSDRREALEALADALGMRSIGVVGEGNAPRLDVRARR